VIEQIFDFFRITPTDSDARQVWVIGDLHGCYSSFMTLLKKIDFDPSKDKLWLTGDLVNRGNGSLQILEYLYGIKDRVRIVLGNHDISMLAISKDLKNSNPTLDPIFQSPEAKKLMELGANYNLVDEDEPPPLNNPTPVPNGNSASVSFTYPADIACVKSIDCSIHFVGLVSG